MPETAAYYADKLVTFAEFDREAVLLLAKVSGFNGQGRNGWRRGIVRVTAINA